IVDRIRKAGATVIRATPAVIGEGPVGTNKLDAMLDRYADRAARSLVMALEVRSPGGGGDGGGLACPDP
ncbi:MAG: hypothetical protein KDB53_16570, partial [Planctomycetes bacterium]|nr:hypothetical protein [Planctomycetota bacterium]